MAAAWSVARRRAISAQRALGHSRQGPADFHLDNGGFRLARTFRRLIIARWWGTVVECASVIAGLERMGQLEEADADRARSGLGRLADTWIEVEPSAAVSSSAQRLLAKHDLTSGDALQLAAALCGPTREGHPLEFVCLDGRLRRGAEREGFTVLP
jgi:predicted nucleic acid-binding protein